jgi:RNA polymerase sigma-70 factor, ECF subfamily
VDRAERFSELYRTQYDAVLSYAWRRTDPETARDVVAETFLVAWRRLDAVPADRGQARPWLYGVARRVLANAERSRRRAERVTAKLSRQHRNGHAPDPAAEVTQRARLDRALASLTASDQEALRLVGWEELDLAEAARAMGISADQSDRAFVIDAAAKDATHAKIVLYLLRVSADGHSTTLTRLPPVLLPPRSPDVVDGIAVSPDGTKLAVALQVNQNPNVVNPSGEIVVYSLAGGATQTWIAPGDKAVSGVIAAAW